MPHLRLKRCRARAFFADAPILILDEATAHLDVEDATNFEFPSILTDMRSAFVVYVESNGVPVRARESRRSVFDVHRKYK